MHVFTVDLLTRVRRFASAMQGFASTITSLEIRSPSLSCMQILNKHLFTDSTADSFPRDRVSRIEIGKRKEEFFFSSTLWLLYERKRMAAKASNTKPVVPQIIIIVCARYSQHDGGTRKSSSRTGRQTQHFSSTFLSSRGLLSRCAQQQHDATFRID